MNKIKILMTLAYSAVVLLFCFQSIDAKASRRVEECGVELYNELDHESCGTIWNMSRSEACGVETYNSRAGDICGVASYQERVDPACGIAAWTEERALNCPGATSEEFWSGWGESCPDAGDTFTSIVSLDSEVRVHRSGFSVSTQTRHKCGRNVLGVCRTPQYNSCRNPGFGVESYNTCSHPSFGVAQWNQCRHPNHGRQAFERCRKPEFGVELFQACEIKKTIPELTEYLAQNKVSIANDGKDLLQFQSNFYSEEKNQIAMGCLIANYQADAIYSGLATELKTQFQNAFSTVFDSAAFTANVCSQAQASSIQSATCADSDTSTKCGNLRRYQDNLALLQTKKAEILDLKNDVVPRQNAAYATELDGLISLMPQEARN